MRSRLRSGQPAQRSHREHGVRRFRRGRQGLVPGRQRGPDCGRPGDRDWRRELGHWVRACWVPGRVCAGGQFEGVY